MMELWHQAFISLSDDDSVSLCFSSQEMIMEKVLESETVRKRISQSSALRQKRKPPEVQFNKAQGAENELLKLDSKDIPSQGSDLKQDRLAVNGFVDGSDASENSLKFEEAPSPVSPLEISKFESKTQVVQQTHNHKNLFSD